MDLVSYCDINAREQAFLESQQHNLKDCILLDGWFDDDISAKLFAFNGL